jgi:hypothetical protein
MKDTKFIELLNLYLDQQIEPADAALLEAEIARKPARRALYQQYCRMHRACTVMFEQSRPASDVGEKLAMAAAAAEEQVLEFPAPRRSYAWVGLGAGLAAAACVAFVFIHRPARAPVPSAHDEIVQITPAPSAAKPVGLVITPVNYQSAGQSPRSIRRMAPPASEPSLEWMHQVQFTPIANVSAEDLVFHRSLPVQSTPASMKLVPGNAEEKSAWQFER